MQEPMEYGSDNLLAVTFLNGIADLQLSSTAAAAAEKKAGKGHLLSMTCP